MPRAERARRTTNPATTPSSAARIVAAACDLAFFLDPKGVVQEVSIGEGLEAHQGWSKLVGRPWRDTVTVESQAKVESLLREAREGHLGQAREINQKSDGLGEVPFRFKAIYLEDEQRVAALGRDLRPLARLQQGLVSSQQAMDREYGRLRQADTRYRVLFHVSSEGVLVVDGSSRKILEANPAAATMVGDAAQSLQGRAVEELFDGKSRGAIQSLIVGVAAGARSIDARACLLGQTDRELTVTATLFRQSGTPVLLVRFWPVNAAKSLAPRASKMLSVLEAMPDGFVVTGADRRILAANTAFCEMVHGNESQVIGEPIERWLGRPNVDINIMLANLRDHGSIKNFATIIRSDFGGPPQEALITAVTALDGKVPCIGFTIRAVSSRFQTPTAQGGALTSPGSLSPTSTVLPRSVEQLRELVGRVPLKTLVRESADLVEKLCIEAALHVSNDNRASAAQLLGLSRQGFYSKLNRYGMADSGDDDAD